MAMTDITGVIYTPHDLKTPLMKELVAYTTTYRMMNVNRTPRRISRTGIYGSTPGASISGTSSVFIFPSPTPPFVWRWNCGIGNIDQTATGNTPSFRNSSEFCTSIDVIFSNDSNVLSVIIQIICDELSVSYGRNLNLRNRMDVADETVQPMRPRLFIHGLLTIDKLDENTRIWIPANSSSTRTPNTFHGRASGYVVRKVPVVVEALGKYKTDF